jgi:nicotinamidase-related amidase
MLKKKNTALVLVDVQERLMSAMHEKDRLLSSLQQLLHGASLLELPILWTEQYPKGLGPTVPELRAILNGREPIEKTTFSCFRCKKFVKALDEISPKQVLLAGIETHICVYQTAAQMAEEGYDVQVVSDAVSSRTPENRSLGLTRMTELGATLTSVEMALFELLRDADHEHFRDVLEIVK